MTIKLKESITNLLLDTFKEIEKSEKEFREIQKQLMLKQDQIKSLNGELNGIARGILTNEEIDLTTHTAELSKDCTEMQITLKPIEDKDEQSVVL